MVITLILVAILVARHPRRAFEILAAVLVAVGGLVALVVHRLRRGATDEAQITAEPGDPYGDDDPYDVNGFGPGSREREAMRAARARDRERQRYYDEGRRDAAGERAARLVTVAERLATGRRGRR